MPGRPGMTLAMMCALAALAIAPGTSAAFPAANGRIGYTLAGDLWTINPDGTGATNLTNSTPTETCPLFAPGGGKIAFLRLSPDFGVHAMNSDGSGDVLLNTRPPWLTYDLGGCTEDWSPDASQVTFTVDDHCDGGGVFNANLDGSPPTQYACDGPICGWDTTPGSPDWGSDGSMALIGCPFQDPDGRSDIWVIGPNRSTITQVTDTHPEVEYGPSFSPDAAQLVYTQAPDFLSSESGIWKINRDGSGRVQLAASPATNPLWAPDGDKIAFTLDDDVWIMDPDGSNKTNLTNDPAVDGVAAWSPDGQRILLTSNRDGDRDIYTIGRDGSDAVQLTNATGNESPFGWQEIPRGYTRPKGATPFRASLTPAYEPCAAPNRTHGPPLAFPSCNPPQQTSDYLTVGTADANAQPALNEGYLVLNVIAGNPGTPADEADVAVEFFMDDVFRKPPPADYMGELRTRLTIQMTDKDNTPYPGGPGPGTTTSIAIEVTVGCTATAATNEGSSCVTATSIDALVPGSVKETRRSMWQLGRVEVYDGGPDGDAQTPSGDTLLATQGLFIP